MIIINNLGPVDRHHFIRNEWEMQTLSYLPVQGIRTKGLTSKGIKGSNRITGGQ